MGRQNRSVIVYKTKGSDALLRTSPPPGPLLCEKPDEWSEQTPLALMIWQSRAENCIDAQTPAP